MWRLFGKLSIRSKLLIMLVGVGVISANLIGWLCNQNGKKAIEERVIFQLRSIRAARSNVIKNYFAELKRQVQTLSEDPLVSTTLRDMSSAYNELGNTPLTDAERKEELDYYQNTFVSRLRKNVQGDPLAQTYMPKSTSGQYVQYHYMVKVKEDDRRHFLKAGDGSRYSDLHAQYHPYLSRICERFNYDDIMLFDAQSQEFIYSVWKEADYGTNLEKGPFGATALAHVVREVMRTRDRGSVVFSDFESYRVTYGTPAAFIAAPIYRGAEFIGVLVIQLPIDELNLVMTSFGQWEREGLGKTGETYIVGQDRLMRSVSRFLVQDQPGYLRSLAKVGYPAQMLEHIEKFETSILQQRIQTPYAEKALAGKEGVMRSIDYRGLPVLAAYAPLRLEGFQWAIVAQSDVSEAFATVDRFEQQLRLYVIGLMVVISFLSLILAGVFTKPIQTILKTIRRVESGDFAAKIPVQTHDEFGQLGSHFNAMLGKLHDQREEIETKSRENEALLLNVLPAAVAQRVKEGQSAPAENFPSVTVLVAHVDHVTTPSAEKPANDSADLLSRIVTLFDSMTEEHSVEPIRTHGATYLAVCGLNIPQLDHPRQMVEFASALVERIQLLRREVELPLKIRVAIHTGPVIAGIIGTRRFIYDVWGETVNVAYSALACVPSDSVLVTQPVHDVTQDQFEFSKIPSASGADGVPFAVWTLRYFKKPSTESSIHNEQKSIAHESGYKGGPSRV